MNDKEYSKFVNDIMDAPIEKPDKRYHVSYQLNELEYRKTKVSAGITFIENYGDSKDIKSLLERIEVLACQELKHTVRLPEKVEVLSVPVSDIEIFDLNKIINHLLNGGNLTPETAFTSGFMKLCAAIINQSEDTPGYSDEAVRAELESMRGIAAISDPESTRSSEIWTVEDLKEQYEVTLEVAEEKRLIKLREEKLEEKVKEKFEDSINITVAFDEVGLIEILKKTKESIENLGSAAHTASQSVGKLASAYNINPSGAMTLDDLKNQTPDKLLFIDHDYKSETTMKPLKTIKSIFNSGTPDLVFNLRESYALIHQNGYPVSLIDFLEIVNGGGVYARNVTGISNDPVNGSVLITDDDDHNKLKVVNPPQYTEGNIFYLDNPKDKSIGLHCGHIYAIIHQTSSHNIGLSPTYDLKIIDTHQPIGTSTMLDTNNIDYVKCFTKANLVQGYYYSEIFDFLEEHNAMYVTHIDVL